jgi:hypothetical protein
MDCAALVIEVDEAVVVIGVRLASIASEVNVNMAGYRHRFIDVGACGRALTGRCQRLGRLCRAQAAMIAAGAHGRTALSTHPRGPVLARQLYHS